MKRIISCLLIILMLIPCVAGCNNTNEPDQNNQQSEEQNKNESLDQGKENVVTEPPAAYNTYDLSDFSIVFVDKDGLEASNSFKAEIKKKTGVDLVQKRNTSAASKHEFIIGDTGKEISKEYFENLKNNCTKYGFIIDGTKVFFSGVDAYTLEKSFDLFVSRYIKGDASIVIEDKLSLLLDIDYKTEKLPLPAENELRLVSHNIIAMKFSYGQKVERLGQLQALYSLLDPDVIGLQECDEPWFKTYKLDEVLGKIGYKLAPVSDSSHANRIMYNDATLTLIESGSTFLDDSSNDTKRSCGWALLEEKSTKKRFIAASVHYSADMADWKYRREQATSLVALLGSLEEKYKVPVMCCGDYNSSPTEYENKSIMEKYYNSARNTATEKVNMKFSTVNEAGELGGKAVTGSAIDHVFFSKSGISANHFETVISYYGYIVSDHLPILFDFNIN